MFFPFLSYQGHLNPHVLPNVFPKLMSLFSINIRQQHFEHCIYMYLSLYFWNLFWKYIPLPHTKINKPTGTRVKKYDVNECTPVCTKNVCKFTSWISLCRQFYRENNLVSWWIVGVQARIWDRVLATSRRTLFSVVGNHRCVATFN